MLEVQLTVQGHKRDMVGTYSFLDTGDANKRKEGGRKEGGKEGRGRGKRKVFTQRC